MKELRIDIDIEVSNYGIGENIILKGLKKGTVFSLCTVDLEFKIADVTSNDVIIEFNRNSDRFAFINNKLQKGEETKLMDTINPSINISIKVIDINEQQIVYYE